MMRFLRLLIACCFALPAVAQQAHQTGEAPSPDGGLLRLRDLTPFGLLRLDLRPPNEQAMQGDDWAFEFDFSYQNTFAMSRNVRQYLEGRGTGRTPLSAADAAAIQALPGDAFYVDGEFGQFDFIAHRRLGERWAASLTVPYLVYGNSALDGLIENFHHYFGFSQQGRDLVARHRFQVVYDIGGMPFAQLSRTRTGGFADPVIALRFEPPAPVFGWQATVEAAAKLALAGERSWLSTGRSDYGVQVALRRANGPNAFHLAGSLVYFAGLRATPAADGRYLPTLIAAYGRRLSPRTSLVLQGHASESEVRDTDIDALAENKYQLSLGFRFHARRFDWTVAVTENIANFHNTPDIGAQLDFVYRP